jgi:DNA primase
MDSSVISLWTKVPEYGDRIVICSSLKDALCLSANTHIPAIAPQGEGYSISNTAANELRRRYKKVFICFDVDKAGLQDSLKLSEQTGFIRVVPDLKGEKDISDYFKSLENKAEFKQLEHYFH